MESGSERKTSTRKIYKYLSLCEEREDFRSQLVDAIKRKKEREETCFNAMKCIEDERKVEEDFVIDIEENDILRYSYYLTRGIDDAYVGSMDGHLLENILKRIPYEWRKKFKEYLNILIREIKEEYVVNVKKSVIEFVIGNSLYSSLNQVQS